MALGACLCLSQAPSWWPCHQPPLTSVRTPNGHHQAQQSVSSSRASVRSGLGSARTFTRKSVRQWKQDYSWYLPFLDENMGVGKRDVAGATDLLRRWWSQLVLGELLRALCSSRVAGGAPHTAALCPGLVLWPSALSAHGQPARAPRTQGTGRRVQVVGLESTLAHLAQPPRCAGRKVRSEGRSWAQGHIAASEQGRAPPGSLHSGGLLPAAAQQAAPRPSGPHGICSICR